MRKLKFFKKDSKKTVVVEIGNDWLKIIASASGSIIKLRFIKLVQIKGTVSDAIRKAFDELKLDKKSAIICIPRHFVTVRILEFPAVKSREIAEMVNLQVGKQTPYSKEEIISAHKIINTTKEGYTKVMLVIARRNIINERIEEMKKAGIGVQRISISSEGLFNWFNMAYMPEIGVSPNAVSVKKIVEAPAFLLIDIDSNYSDIIIIRKGKFVYTRNILIGAKHLFEEKDKWQSKFIEEVAHCVELYHNEDRHVKIEKMLLSGASKCIDGLNHVLSAKIDAPTEIIPSEKNIEIRDNINILHKEEFKSVSVNPLLGMSLKEKNLELDLTPTELRIQKMMEVKRRQITVFGILITAVVMMISLLLTIIMHNKNNYLQDLKYNIAQMEKEANEVDRMRRSISFMEERLEIKKISINILREIYKLTPKEIHFTEINIEEKEKIVLRGFAFTLSDVFAFVPALEGSEYFSGVKTNYTRNKKVKSVEYIQFEIVGLIENHEPL